MLIFLNIKYTDLVYQRVMSIGCLSGDKKFYLYAELNDYDIRYCDDHAKTKVIPNLNGSGMTTERLKSTLEKWFYELPKPIVMMIKNKTQYELLLTLIDTKKCNLTDEPLELSYIKKFIEYRMGITRYYETNPKNNAYHDAVASQVGWLSCVNSFNLIN